MKFRARALTRSFLLHQFGFALLHSCGQEPIQAEAIFDIDGNIYGRYAVRFSNHS